MQKTNAPCYECKVRHDGCHSHCGPYRRWQRQREELRKLKEGAHLCAPPHRKDDD